MFSKGELNALQHVAVWHMMIGNSYNLQNSEYAYLQPRLHDLGLIHVLPTGNVVLTSYAANEMLEISEQLQSGLSDYLHWYFAHFDDMVLKMQELGTW